MKKKNYIRRKPLILTIIWGFWIKYGYSDWIRIHVIHVSRSRKPRSKPQHHHHADLAPPRSIQQVPVRYHNLCSYWSYWRRNYTGRVIMTKAKYAIHWVMWFKCFSGFQSSDLNKSCDLYKSVSRLSFSCWNNGY